MMHEPERKKEYRRKAMFIATTEGCQPTRGSKYSAFVDLYSAEDVVIDGGETAIVDLGVRIDSSKLFDDFKKKNYMQLELRSSMRAKGFQAGTGVIDLDFKSNLKLIIHAPNRFSQYTINKGDKIAQISLIEHKSWMFGIDSEEERNGGLGSTGK